MSHGSDTSNRSDDSDEFDKVVDNFEKTESARRRKGLIYAAVAVLGLAAIIAVVFVFRVDFFEPDYDVQKGEKKVLAKTNDPQCRQMIADVQAMAKRYYAIEPTIDDKLLGDDARAIAEIRDEIARLQQRVDELAESSQQAELRFDDSRDQLDEWFDYVAVELSFVDRLADDRLAELKDRAEAARAAAKIQAANKGGDRGSKHADVGADGVVVDEGIVVEEGDADANKPGSKEAESGQTESDKASEKSPKQRKTGALVAIHDAFKKFEVWHSGALHPCGVVEASETPWTPSADQ